MSVAKHTSSPTLAVDAFALTGRTALVTGASGGIGAHLAAVCARAGARTVLGARRLERLAPLARAIEGTGGEALPIELDITDSASLERAVDTIEAVWGPVDLLVNNAGAAVTAPALGVADADWATVLSTNLDGPFRLARRVAHALVAANRGGTIVNIASVLGLRGAGGLSSYVASKAALINLTRALAIEWARHGIRVNALAPGYVETDINRAELAGEFGRKLLSRVPMRRFGTLDDLDGPFLLLASDAGRFMTGSVVTVDGGHTAGL